MEINIALTEKQNILALLQSRSKGQMTDFDFSKHEDEFEIGQPVEISSHLDYNHPNDHVEPNTEVTITAKDDSVLVTGSCTLRYRRLSIEDQWKIIFKTDNSLYRYSPEKYVGGLTEEGILMDFFVRVFPIQLDFLDMDFDLNGEEGKVTRTAKEDSYLFTGQKIIGFKPKVVKPAISKVIPGVWDDFFAYDATPMGSLDITDLGEAHGGETHG